MLLLIVICYLFTTTGLLMWNVGTDGVYEDEVPYIGGMITLIYILIGIGVSL